MTSSHTESDPRFSLGLIADVRDVLKKHGYGESTDDAVYGRFLADLLQLVRGFEHRPDDPMNAENTGK